MAIILSTTMAMIRCPICASVTNEPYLAKNSYQLHRCQECDLVFVFPIPPGLVEFYQESYFHNDPDKPGFGYADYEQDKEPMIPVFESHLKKIKSLISGGRLFDVGAATGFFLDLARRDGWQTGGIELSMYAATQAARRGHQVTTGRLPDLNSPGQWEVITMWDVLEHVDDPVAYIQKARDMLAPAGLLAINTINHGSWWAKLMGPRWHLLVPPEHLLYFSEKNLCRLLVDQGFEILEMRSIGKKFSLAYIFKMLYQWQGLKVWHWLTKIFNTSIGRRFTLPVNLGDNIFILARRIK